MLPGVEGKGWQLTAMIAGLREAEIDHEIEIIPWGRYPLSSLDNLMNIERNRERAQAIAERLTGLMERRHDCQITLLGYSGGGGVAVMSLERLPEEVRISRLILIAPALSPSYDLSAAAAHVERDITCFYSARDTFFLGLGTFVFGTIDRDFTESAGRVGFNNEQGELVAGDRVRQISWQPEWFSLGHWGGHLGWLAKPWAREVLAPLLLDGPAALNASKCAQDGENEHSPSKGG